MRAVLMTVLMCLIVSGCTVTLDNPLVKKEPEDMKLIRQRIAAFELLEREAELKYSLTKLSVETEELKNPPKPVEGPAGPAGPKGDKGDKGDKGNLSIDQNGDWGQSIIFEDTDVQLKE